MIEDHDFLSMIFMLIILSFEKSHNSSKFVIIVFNHIFTEIIFLEEKLTKFHQPKFFFIQLDDIFIHSIAKSIYFNVDLILGMKIKKNKYHEKHLL